MFSYTCEVIKCKDQKPGEKMGLIQRSRDQEIQRSRDPEIKTDTSQLIQSKKLINDHTRGKSYTICEEKNLSANAMERDQ